MGNEIKNGTIINGRYEITQKIGTGGMADVYKARCHKLGRYVAIKFLKEEHAKDREFVERFEAEARAAAGIAHSNIVSVYDFGESDGRKYIVMEYVEGITLKEYIAHHGALTWREAASVAGQICSGLACAHKNGIIHRDIKPQNIILTQTGVAKIGDFGIARIASRNTIVKADSRSIIGSAHYFSPEQAVGGDVDKTTDIYSLGVVLFEMLTGTVPFDSSNPISLSVMHSKSPVPPIENYTQNVPDDLKKVVYKAMSKDRSERYAAAEMMLSDIKNILKGMPAQYTEEKVPKRRNALAGASAVKNTKFINTVCITVIAIVAVIIIALTVSSIASWNKKPNSSDSDEITSSENVDNNEDDNNEDDNNDNNDDKEEIDVPDVLHNKEDAAKKTLSDAGFKVKTEKKQTEDVNEVGTVVSQSPKSGEKAEKGSEITIYIGEKKEDENEIKVSKAVGLTEAEATVMFESSFKVKVSYKDTTDAEEDGVVLGQKPSEGEKLAKGSTITLTVGKYKEPKQTEEPNEVSKERTQNVSITVPSDGDGEKWVRVRVNGSDILNKTYSAGQNVSVSVNLREGEKKTVEFYVNEQLFKTEEVSY